MAPLNDTSLEAEEVLVNVFRQMPMGRKWLLMGKTYDDGRLLHAIGVRLRNPSATPGDILEDWMRNQLGFTNLPSLSEPAKERPMQSMHDLREVLRVFTTLGIPYALGGSMASSIHGIRRDTSRPNHSPERKLCLPLPLETITTSVCQPFNKPCVSVRRSTSSTRVPVSK